MGAWGVEIFQDDVACDARLALYDLFRQGLLARQATDAVLEELADFLNDEEDGTVVILALAAAQWDAGRLDKRIKSRAMKIIAEGVDFRWQNNEHQEQRRAVLMALGVMLNSTPPTPRPVDELDEPIDP